VDISEWGGSGFAALHKLHFSRFQPIVKRAEWFFGAMQQENVAAQQNQALTRTRGGDIESPFLGGTT
jgi:hypothetical protein